MSQGRAHLDTRGHEVRSCRCLPPESQMQPSFKRLTTCPEIRVAEIPPERLLFDLFSGSIAKVGFLRRAEFEIKTFFP